MLRRSVAAQSASLLTRPRNVDRSFGGMCAFSNEVIGQETEGRRRWLDEVNPGRWVCVFPSRKVVRQDPHQVFALFFFGGGWLGPRVLGQELRERRRK